MDNSVKDKVLLLIQEEADVLADTYEANYDFNAIITRMIELNRPDLGIRLVVSEPMTLETIYKVGNMIDDVEERNELVDALKQRRKLIEEGFNPFNEGTQVHDDYAEYMSICEDYTDGFINDIKSNYPEIYEEIVDAVERIISRATVTRI